MSILSLLYAVVVNALISCHKEKNQTWPILLTFVGLKLASVCICRHYSSNLCVTQTLLHRASYRQLSCYLCTVFVLDIFSILFQVKHYGNPTFWDHFCKEYPSYKSNIASLKAQ